MRASISAGVRNDTSCLSKPFGGDGEHPLDELGVFGVPQGRVGEQRPDRGQAQVAGSRPVVPVGFEMLQERADHLHVEVGPVQCGRRFPGALLDEHEQQLQRIPVGSDRAWADPTLLDQPLGEEALQVGAIALIVSSLPARTPGAARPARAIPVRPTGTSTSSEDRDAPGRQGRQLGLDWLRCGTSPAGCAAKLWRRS